MLIGRFIKILMFAALSAANELQLVIFFSKCFIILTVIISVNYFFVKYKKFYTNFIFTFD